MDGVHDMGGMHGFGRVVVEADEPVFHAPWEGRVRAMAALLREQGLDNIDAFRHAIERMEPGAYLTTSYYGRWAVALETLLVEAGVLAPGELEAHLGKPASSAGPMMTPVAEAAATVPPRSASGVIRPVSGSPRFAVGQQVRARNLHPSGHTRLPRYVRGRRGVVQRANPACIFPDTHAHGRGEDPQYVYSVRFAAAELWGEGAEPGAAVSLDLFEPYLEPVEPAG
jgi:nitrile hydratase beta subunit